MNKSSRISWALWPLAALYGAATYVRSSAYRARILRPRRVGVPVISVGNLTAGGTGKTPMVELLAKKLTDEKKRVGILTRGYKGQTIEDGSSTSDEVQLLKESLGDSVRIGVGANRYVSGRKLQQEGIEWLILDDGFQHRQLARDADIVLLDATSPFGRGRLLPVGRLREPKSALGRADVVVITRSKGTPAVEAAIRHYSRAPIFYAYPALDYIQSLNTSGGGLLPQGRLRKWFAFCGIGNPDAFVADLRSWNFDLAGYKFFPDHHRYTEKDAQAIEKEAGESGADTLICTEKDKFNLSNPLWFAYEVDFARISMKMVREEEFWRAVMAAVERHRSPEV